MEEEAKAMAKQHHQQQAAMQQQHHQQQAVMQQQHHQQQVVMHHQQQQHYLLLQQLQRQKQQQQQDAMSRFPSNIDAHLRPQQHHLQHFLNRPILNNPQSHQNPNFTPNSNNPNSNSNPFQLFQNQSSNHQQPNPNNNFPNNNNNSSTSHPQHQSQQQKINRGNPADLQMAYQDAWRVCHPDFKRPFSSLEDACERLLPYHVVADYEAEEDDKTLELDATGQMLSRSQLWDNNISAKLTEFTATFEKQIMAFNIVTRKRGQGEFRTEEKLLMEQLLLQEERRAQFEVRSEIDSRQRIAAVTPIRGSVYVSQDMSEQNPDMIMNGWANNNNNNINNAQRDEKEPSEDFLNDEETDNGDTGMQSNWSGGGEFDLNSR